MVSNTGGAAGLAGSGGGEAVVQVLQLYTGFVVLRRRCRWLWWPCRR